MGLVGRMIDTLTDEQRDRILRAPPEDWHPDGTKWMDAQGRKCLFGHALDVERTVAGVITGPPLDPDEFLSSRRAQMTEDWRPCCAPHAQTGEWYTRTVNAPTKFPALVRRFGLERMIRACKLRAGKGNRVEVEVPAREPAAVR